MPFRVVPVPVLEDNFAYLLVHTPSNTGVAVDPAEPEKVLQAAQKEGVRLHGILTTHHHPDHAQGNAQLASHLGNVPVYGGDDRVQALTNKVTDGQVFTICDIPIKSLSTPCHTTGSVCFYVEEEGESAIFTGDTLFIGGCGRFFEGNAQQMYHNMAEVFAKLPPTTKVYCGHEYTVANLKFAQHIEPNNEAIKTKLNWAKSQREAGVSTVPSTLAEEATFNPFMRTHEPDVQKVVGSSEPVKVMELLRDSKNNFKG